MYLAVSGDDLGVRSQDLHKIHAEPRSGRSKHCSDFNLKVIYISVLAKDMGSSSAPSTNSH